VLLAALSPAGVEVGVDLRHRGGVVDGGGWVVGIVVVAGRFKGRSRWLDKKFISVEEIHEFVRGLRHSLGDVR